MNVIFGSAGFAKEVDWLLEELSLSGSQNFRASHFVSMDQIGEMINGKSVLAESAFLSSLDSDTNYQAFIAIGSPKIRRKIYEHLSQFPQLQFPSVQFPRNVYDRREGKIIMGDGNIICAGTVLTSDIILGSQVHINLNCTIGHDTQIGDFCTLSPGVHVSGNVHMGKEVFVGTGAVILERLSICDSAVIGAGSVVTKSITEPGTYVGTPAKKLK